MQLELTPEIENFLQAESSATGLAPAEVALRVLADRARPAYAQIGRIVSTESLLKVEPVSEEMMELRRAAVARIIARQQAPGAPRLDLPEGMTIRQYAHADHRYKD